MSQEPRQDRVEIVPYVGPTHEQPLPHKTTPRKATTTHPDEGSAAAEPLRSSPWCNALIILGAVATLVNLRLIFFAFFDFGICFDVCSPSPGPNWLLPTILFVAAFAVLTHLYVLVRYRSPLGCGAAATILFSMVFNTIFFTIALLLMIQILTL